MSFPKDSRRKANARDKARHRWIKQGDGDNRASLRKAIGAIVNPAKRRERKELMTHRQDLKHLMQHPLAGGGVRNLRKAQRKARRA